MTGSRRVGMAYENTHAGARSGRPQPVRGTKGKRKGARRYYHCGLFFSSRRRHTRLQGDWSSDVCSSDLRSLSREPRYRHEAAHALRDLVEARPVAVRPVLPEAGYAREDDARVDLRERLVIDAQAELHIGTIVLDDDVGGLRELHEDCHTLLRLQVEGDRALVAVQVLEIRAVARAAHRIALDARRRFDLDHVGSEIRELPHAGRPGAHARKIEDAKARKRGGGGNVGHGRAGILQIERTAMITFRRGDEMSARDHDLHEIREAVAKLCATFSME